MFGLSKPNPKDKGAKLAQAQNQAPDSIPGMFKPGEFVLPPDTVHAMGGKQALQGVVDSTHTPVAASFGLNEARASVPQAQATPQIGLKPEVFFANGGAPEDQLARAAISPANTFPQGSPSAGANIYAGAGVSRDQFGSSGKLAQIPPGIGGNPGAPERVQPVAASPVATESPTPANPGSPVASNPITAPSPSNTFPGNRLQGASGFSGAPAAMAVTDPSAELRRVADKNSRGESYGSNAPGMASFGLNSPAPAAAAAPATAQAIASPAAARTPGASELYMQDRTQEMGDQWSAGNYAQAAGTAGRTAVQGLGMYGLELADKTLTPAGTAIGGFAKGLFGMNDAQAATTAPAVTAPAPTSNAKSATNPAATTTTVPGAKAGAVTPGVTAAPTAPAASTAAPTAGEVSPGVYNHGRGQYSDNAAGMGLPAGFTGKPSAQNMAAAANLATANAAPGVSAAQEGGFGLSAPTVAHSGNDWAARQRLKNLETSASSITNTDRWGGKGASRGADVQNFIDASRADLAAQGKEPDMQLRTNEVNAGLRRTAMAEAGADRRAQGQIGLGLGQLALGAQRNNLDAQRINSDERLRAPQIRAAERLGQLQDAYINAKTPEEQATIAAQMRAYSGKDSDSWKAVALQGGTDAQGNKTESMLGAVNERTGEMKRMGAQQKAPEFVQGTVYQDAKGNKQRWNGSAFEPL